MPVRLNLSHDASPYKVLAARAIGVAMALAVYGTARMDFPFRGMHRSYDLLTAAVVGSLVGGIAAAALWERGNTARLSWAYHGIALPAMAAILFWVDRRWNIDMSVRLVVISLMATYEVGAPAVPLWQRALFAPLPVLGAALHASIFAAGVVSPANLGGIAGGIAGGILALLPVYRRRTCAVSRR